MGSYTFDDAELIKFYGGINVFALEPRQLGFLRLAQPALRARERLREGLAGLEVDQVIDLAKLAYDDDDVAQSYAEARMKQIMDEKTKSDGFNL